jgi:hypothetical protein
VIWLAGIASFCAVFLKGFQQQNVIGGHYRLAFIFSYLMAMAEVAVVSTVVVSGWGAILPVGTGAAFGITISMYIHKRFVKGVK